MVSARPLPFFVENMLQLAAQAAEPHWRAALQLMVCALAATQLVACSSIQVLE